MTTAPDPTLRQRSRRRWYAIVLIALGAALAARYLGPYWLSVYRPGRGATFAQALQVVASVSMLADAMPRMVSLQIFQKFPDARGILNAVLVGFFWLQIGVLSRRALILAANRAITPPAFFNGWWFTAFMVALFSWLIGALLFLSPIYLRAFGLPANLIFAAQVANTYFTGMLLVPANLFGICFLLLELISLAREPLIPRFVANARAAA